MNTSTHAIEALIPLDGDNANTRDHTPRRAVTVAAPDMRAAVLTRNMSDRFHMALNCALLRPSRTAESVTAAPRPKSEIGTSAGSPMMSDNAAKPELPSRSRDRRDVTSPAIPMIGNMAARAAPAANTSRQESGRESAGVRSVGRTLSAVRIG